ncbi:MAG: penicillin-binding protein activator [Gammaproteobacteria bacterium]|nr:penicillin-binding protein activator [Gammaproteobacteria bacterium]
MKPISRRLAPLFLLLLVLSACETAPRRIPEAAAPQPEPLPASVRVAEQAEKAGEFVIAAREYESLARQAGSPQREHYTLKTIESLIKAGQLREAHGKLRTLDVSRLEAVFGARKQLLETRLAILEAHPDEALRQLDRIDKISGLSPALIADLNRQRAQAHLALDQPLPAFRSLLAREQALSARADVTANQQEIWQALSGLSRTQIAKELRGQNDAVVTGWLDLALAALENAGRRTALANAVERWRTLHPGHPATDDFLKTIAQPRAGQIGYVEQIALLLPLTSDYAQAAGAVRDGFLAMQAVDRNPNKPRVTVIDIGADPAQANAAYEKAIQGGAQLIVGPLGLEAAEQVARKTKLEVPTLLLSQISESTDTAGKPIYQFGLPPEQEAIQTAERAWLDGHRQVAVLTPDSAWGRRMQTAFVNAWQRLGGIVVSGQNYLPGQNEYAEPVKRLLNINQSEARRERIEETLKMKLKFEARPREDVDFIFLAADAKLARLIKPQLNYNRALRIPVYATSNVFTGRGDPGLDIDLDGIQFGDMPWMLVGDGRIADLRKSLPSASTYARSGLDRLYALGVDAYALIPQLDRLASENGSRFSGVTSGLSIGNGGRIHRQLLWAQYRKGVPVLLDGFLRLKGQFEIDGADSPATRSGG